MGTTHQLPRRDGHQVFSVVIATLAVLIWCIVSGPLLSAQEPPQHSIFIISVWDRRAVAEGTAFFISSDGRALTASHVVYQVRKDRRYRLLAIVGNEFYSASLTCASELADAVRSKAAPSRDVAEIRLTSSDFPFDQITHNNAPYARAHRGPLPSFAALPFGPDPRSGDRVRVLGFGAASQLVPYAWSAEGEVSRTTVFGDGTLGFNILFDARPVAPGHSGSPVLNAAGQVVGLLGWHDGQDTQVGTAISSQALQPACP